MSAEFEQTKHLRKIVEAMHKGKGLPIIEEDKAVLMRGIPPFLNKDKGEELGFYEENGQWYAVIGKPRRKNLKLNIFLTFVI